MSTRLARTSVVVVFACVLVATALAQSNPALPQNFRLREMTFGPGRTQASMILLWEQAKAPGTNVPYTKYQLTAGCAYTASGQDQLSGASNSKMLTGPGPAYSVRAICSCDRGQTGPAVRVGSVNKQPWVYINPTKYVICPAPPPPQ